ncbi:Non-specific serine/threonine protein kinase [Caenorhabditis elegans]|uniref:Non-specific serine/threonine protein kinase n=1 Tax=Caenorhabditis elegans TaxID=6239 RepID=G5EDV8_CAEEL|nr:Non-specific serine/threonine protein kinase [Caenorhabditis elegans]CAH04748.1 Non-specific serine/threonine protein kinase [Caenorhabditis elegans]|eukprot:NP_001022270.1 Uncharacterized protein CELE_R05H10.3 [Caenorhabditis elegans]
MDLLLERLVSICSVYDELPHSFDDTLIDKLVDSIQFEAVIRWAINEIDQEHTSVFLRRRYSDFICQVPSTEARRLLIISGAVEIFARRSRASPSSCIADAATQILSRYAMDLAAEECITYVESLRNSPRQGERSLKLLVKLKEIHSNLTIPLTPGSWSNESNRVDVISLLLALNPNPCDGIEAYRDNDHLIENVDQLIDMLLYSPAVKIYHKTKILHRMNERHFKTFFEQLIVDVKIESKITIGEVTGLLSSLAPRASHQQMAQLFESLGGRVLESRSLLQELFRIYGPDVFEFPEFSDFKNRLRTLLTNMIRTSMLESAWEQTDTALEIAYIFPCFLPENEDIQALSQNNRNSPYVMCSVLKLMRDHYGGIPEDLIRHFLLESADPAPKLICMKYLSNPDFFDSLSAEELEKYLDAGLSDDGMEMRQEAIKLAEKALGKAQLKDRVIDVITEYKNDRWLSRYVRRLLCEELAPQPENESILILRQMLSSLNVHANEDEVKDCY